MGVRSLSRLKFAIVVLALMALVYLTHAWWLPAAATALIHDDGPGKADLAVVLAGDYWGRRVLHAAELVKQGYVPEVLVSGPPGFYGLNEADAAIQFAVARGYPKEWFIPLRHSAMSTQDEAGVLVDELRRRGVHSFLLVTSNFHTGRARRIFLATERAHGDGPGFRTVAAPDEFFSAGNWWRSRQARKIVFMEWSKTLATAVGM